MWWWKLFFSPVNGSFSESSEDLKSSDEKSVEVFSFSLDEMVSVSEESGYGAGASLGGTSVAVWMSPDSETGSVESFGSESADSEKAKISDIS